MLGEPLIYFFLAVAIVTEEDEVGYKSSNASLQSIFQTSYL